MMKSKDHSLISCKSGDELFSVAPLKKYITEIKNLVSCPNDIFESLYLSVLYQLAEYCQMMPFSRKEFSNPYGLIERQLQLSIATLKLRRGLLLPKNAGAETISVDEAQWTYAIFLAALFRDIHSVQHDRAVYLHYENGEKSGRWNPLSGSLYEKNLYYRIEFVEQKQVENTAIFMAVLAGRIIPAIVFRWLSGNIELSQYWWNSILHNQSQLSDISKLIEEAGNKLGINLLHADTKEKNVPQQEWLDHFIEWAMQRVKNSPDSIFRLQQGLFISEAIMDDYFSEIELQSTPSFLQKLQKANGVIMNKDSLYHSLCSKNFEDRRVLRGIVMNHDLLPTQFNHLPLNTHFQENLSL